MARRKKQKTKSDVKAQLPQASRQQSIEAIRIPVNSKEISREDKVPARMDAQKRQASEYMEEALREEKPKVRGSLAKEVAAREGGVKSGVRFSTCVAGMFLAFLLGIYLGIMLPQITQELAGKQPMANVENTASAPPPSAEAGDSLTRIIAGLEEKLEHSPENVDDWISLGNAYFDAGRAPLAISAYERALAFKPDNADVLTDLGIMYRESGRPEKALECFRRAIKINPAHQNAMYNEGVVLAMDLDKKEDAGKAWARLLEVNPQAKAPDGRPLRDMIKNLH